MYPCNKGTGLQTMAAVFSKTNSYWIWDRPDRDVSDLTAYFRGLLAKSSTWKRVVMSDTTSKWHICFTRLKTGRLSTETVCNASSEVCCETLAVSGTVPKCRESQRFKISHAMVAEYSNAGVPNNLLPIRQSQYFTCYSCQDDKLILKYQKRK